MYKALKGTEKMVVDEMENIANTTKVVSAELVWNMNNDALKSISKQLLENPSIESIAFIDNKKTIITKAERQISKTDTKQDHRSISVPINYGAKNEVIGTIALTYNLNKIDVVKNEMLKSTLWGAVIAQISLCFFLFYVLKKTTTRISIITERLRAVSLSNQISSEEVHKISEEVSSATQQQASSIQETVTTLDEIESMVNTSVESARNSSLKAEESLNIANEGKGVVKLMINSMEEIDKSNNAIMEEFKKSNEKIAGIVKVINEISQKTAVINDIVFQTKLLSFNASVEAARAGENGKGFAVVAEEVGNLAQMSGKASNEIAEILSNSVNIVNTIISETDRSITRLIVMGTEKVKEGVEVADRCGRVLDEVVENAALVKTMMNEVSVASKEQADGVKNIGQAMNQLDQTTQGNSISAQRTFQSSKNLSDQSNELKDTVGQLELEIFGDNKIIAS